MTAAVPPSTLALLVCIALVSGVGITAVGPGGIFVTVALFALTDLRPAVVVGTASATFVATGLLGTLSYYRSGELDSAAEMRTAAILSLTGLAGALVGVRLNAFVDADTFSALLGGLVTLTGVLVFARTRYGGDADAVGDGGRTAPNHLVTATIGGFVGVAGGLVGVGGPVIAVPLLVAGGVPILLAVGVAQVQSIFIAAFATAGYVVRGAVDWRLALAIGVPELVGAVVGWRVAQSVDDVLLTRVLAALMLVLGPYIAFG